MLDSCASLSTRLSKVAKLYLNPAAAAPLGAGRAAPGPRTERPFARIADRASQGRRPWNPCPSQKAASGSQNTARKFRVEPAELRTIVERLPAVSAPEVSATVCVVPRPIGIIDIQRAERSAAFATRLPVLPTLNCPTRSSRVGVAARRVRSRQVEREAAQRFQRDRSALRLDQKPVAHDTRGGFLDDRGGRRNHVEDIGVTRRAAEGQRSSSAGAGGGIDVVGACEGSSGGQRPGIIFIVRSRGGRTRPIGREADQIRDAAARASARGFQDGGTVQRSRAPGAGR